MEKVGSLKTFLLAIKGVYRCRRTDVLDLSCTFCSVSSRAAGGPCMALRNDVVCEEESVSVLKTSLLEMNEHGEVWNDCHVCFCGYL